MCISECRTYLFLSYYPLKQGLKHGIGDEVNSMIDLFLSYYPLKQGLKRRGSLAGFPARAVFLSYYPLKQGLKLKLFWAIYNNDPSIFILLSIKTRIETDTLLEEILQLFGFLSYYPLKQGLKQEIRFFWGDSVTNFYPTIH